MGKAEEGGSPVCPALEVIRDYAGGSQEDWADLERHLDQCERCSRILDCLRDSLDKRDFDAAIAPRLEPRGPRDESDRYRLDREIGRGAFGEVWAAEDAQLGRRVAVKTIRRDCDAAQYSAVRLRFDREARITGLLQHPGIMPVISYARDETGRPFYAMPLILNATLRDEIHAYHRGKARGEMGRRSVAFQALLGRFLAACQAVAYAHARGVIHRDLKPGNILVGAFGETLVADWGLAKVIGVEDRPIPDGMADLPTIPPDIDLTAPGGKVGTPGYMSPEAWEGDVDRIDSRSDVYSLGAILSLIATGARPFPGPGPAQTPGSSPLISIANRARNDDPGDRYQSAEELAADVRRWLADEPVLAHPDSLAVRMARWGRRHRTAATALLVGLILTLAGSAGFATVLARKNGDLRQAGERAIAERERAVAERERAATLLIRLVNSAQENITNLSSERALQTPEMEQPRFRLLDNRRNELTQAQEDILAIGDAGLTRRLASLRIDLGQVYFKQGRTAEALSDHEAAVFLGRKALGKPPGDEESRAFLAHALYRCGRIAHALNDHDKTDACFRECLEIYQDLHGSEHAFNRFEIIGAIGAVQKNRLNPAATETILRAIAIYRDEVPEDVKAQANPRRIYAGTLLNLAMIDLETGVEERTQRGVSMAEEASTILLALAEENPKDHESAFWAAKTLWLLGEIQQAQGKTSAALPLFREAVRRVERLHEDLPSDQQYSDFLGVIRPLLKAIESLPREGDPR